MKKYLNIVLLLIYLPAAVGVSMSVHYCAGKFESVRVLAETKSCCCGDEMNKGCCQEEVSYVKLADDSQEFSQSTSFNIAPALVTRPDFSPLFRVLANTGGQTTCCIPDPPDISGQKVYLRIESLLI